VPWVSEGVRICYPGDSYASWTLTFLTVTGYGIKLEKGFAFLALGLELLAFGLFMVGLLAFSGLAFFVLIYGAAKWLDYLWKAFLNQTFPDLSSAPKI
jgi:hypothetical protein